MDLVTAFTNKNLNIEITIKGSIENPLFKASDIGEVLEIKNIHQTIHDFDDTEKVLILNDTPGGTQNVIFLTEEGLYRTLMKSRKPIAVQFQKWICSILKEIRLKGKFELEKKVIENEQKLLTISKERSELQKKLNEANEKNKRSREAYGSIYIGVQEKERHKQIYKVGYAKNEKDRESSLNTPDMDRCFRILNTFQTKDRFLSEILIHTYLKHHKVHYNGEFFTIDLNKLISICNVFTKFVDQLTDISMDELYLRLVSSDSTLPIIVNNEIEDKKKLIIKPNTNNKKPKIKTRYFSSEVYEHFLSEKVIYTKNIKNCISSQKIRDTFYNWIIEKNINPLKSRKLDESLINNMGFKIEFSIMINNILKIRSKFIMVDGIRSTVFYNIDIKT